MGPKQSTLGLMLDLKLQFHIGRVGLETNDLPGRWEALDWVELEFRKIGYAGAGRICHYPFSHPWPCTKWVLSLRIPDHLF